MNCGQWSVNPELWTFNGTRSEIHSRFTNLHFKPPVSMKTFSLIGTAVLSIFLYACGGNKSDSDRIDSDSIGSDTVVDVVEPDSTMLLTGNEDEYVYGEEFKLENYVVTDKHDTADLVQISKSIALIVDPTEEQITEMQKDSDEEEFYTMADDATYYHGMAIGLIDSMNVETISATSRYVKFIGADNKSWVLDLRGTNAAPWNIIFFNINKEPEIISDMDLDVAKIRSYFDLKSL